MKVRDLCLAFALASALAACGGGDGSDDTSTDGDAPTDQPSSCRQDPDPLNPHYRMTLLDLTAPDRLDNPSLEEGVIREALNQETFLWLIRFTGVDDGTTDTDGTMGFETGAGFVEDVDHQGCYPLWNDPGYPNRTGTLDISGDDFSWPGAAAPIHIQVTNFERDYTTFLLELPLKEVRITEGSFSPDRTTIGTLSGGAWSCGAYITGKITVADARSVEIADLNQTLCGLLSGDIGLPDDMSDDCASDTADWPAQPDSDFGGEPAYSMAGCFAAEQVIVID
jgi:hypothetical protein